MDNWADDDDLGETRMQRRSRQQQSRDPGPRREQRFAMTLAVASAVMLVLGAVAGFAIGRATAPKAPAPAAVATETAAATTETATQATETVPATVSVEPTPTAPVTPPADKTAPKTPTQISPDDGAKLTASTVTLKWSKVSDPSGVTYSLEVQKYLGSSKWSTVGTFTGLKTTSYKLSTFTTRRRWRVWAVDGAGNKSSMSGWSSYSRKVTTTTPSKTTTKTP